MIKIPLRLIGNKHYIAERYRLCIYQFRKEANEMSRTRKVLMYLQDSMTVLCSVSEITTINSDARGEQPSYFKVGWFGVFLFKNL